MADFTNDPPAGITVPGATMDNGAPAGVTVPGATMDNGTPAGITVAGATMDNSAPAVVTVPGSTMENAAPSMTSVPTSVGLFCFGAGGAIPSVDFYAETGHSVYQFTTPFDGQLVPTVVSPPGNLEADIDGTPSIPFATWPTLGVIAKGKVIKVRIPSTVAWANVPVEQLVQFNQAPLGIAVPNSTATNTAPAGLTVPGSTMDNTAPTEIVVSGSVAPVLPIQAPASPTTVDHTVSLVAGTNYRVLCISRGAPVTIALPDPGSVNQSIEIVDASLQAVTFPVTINGGTKNVVADAAGANTYVLNRTGSSIQLVYVGAAGWKFV